MLSLPFYEDPRLLDRLEDQLQPHSEENQVKAKKSANLQDQFRRIDPKSSIDKIHKDLVDALQRASRITKLFESRIRQEFPGNKKRPLVTKTRVPRSHCTLNASESPASSSAWILDSGASDHFCNDAAWYEDLQPFE
ncbi:unnamed protein product, partial [Aphanomyces euteiches]